MSDVLVVNAGSTSLKLSMVAPSGAARPIPSLDDAAAGSAAAVGHRIVHGGSAMREPTLVTDRVKRAIEEVSALAPLHNGPALAALAQAERALPTLPHVAVFDTGFHATLAPEASVYPIPWAWTEELGIRRYGFHGLSVAWSAERAHELLGQPDDLRLVVCHLGGGCSITAVAGMRSVDTTMGFSPLEGVAMATRSGSIDPSALLYLLRRTGLSVPDVDRILNEESGLKGLSGVSGDVARLEASAAGNERAELALRVYHHRISAAVAAMATSLGGLDALVFTAGVGENSLGVRQGVCERLGFLGIELDHEANRAARPDAEISTPASEVRVLVIHAREDIMIARAVRGLLEASR
jgi:acetate kinase